MITKIRIFPGAEDTGKKKKENYFLTIVIAD